MAFSPDGRLLASCGGDRTVRLWDPATGEHRRTLTGHTSSVTAVAFSPDGRLLASGSDDRTVRLWDPATGEHRRTLTGHTDFVSGGGVQPGRAAAGQRRRRQDGAAVGPGHRRAPAHPDRPHRHWVKAVAFSPDGRLLASGGNDKTVRLWDPATGEHRRTLTGHTGSVSAVAFSPDGRLLASGGGDRTVRLWDPATGEHRRTLTGHSGRPCVGVAFSPDGRLLASGGGPTRRCGCGISPRPTGN